MTELKLNFPFNVYAKILAWENESLYALHYAFLAATKFHTGDFSSGQQQLEQYVLTQLGTAKPKNNKVLQVDAGLGTLAQQIDQAGFAYTGLVNGKQQQHYCQQGNPQLNYVSSDFLHLDEQQRYDFIVLLESAKQFNPSHLLAKLTALLNTGGQAIIIDTMPTQLLRHLSLQLEQIELQLLTQQDLTAQILPALDYLLELLYKHRLAVIETLAIPRLKFSHLCHQMELRRQQFIDQKQSYLMLKLAKL